MHSGAYEEKYTIVAYFKKRNKLGRACKLCYNNNNNLLLFKCFTMHIFDKLLKVPNFQSTDPNIATVKP